MSNYLTKRRKKKKFRAIVTAKTDIIQISAKEKKILTKITFYCNLQNSNIEKSFFKRNHTWIKTQLILDKPVKLMPDPTTS